MTRTPFAELGLDDDASAEAVREARRRLAKDHHPDRGGDADRMRSINVAAAQALRVIAARSTATIASDPTPTSAAPTRPTPAAEFPWGGLSTDAPSFTVEALPVETFEAVLIVAASLGDVIDDDPPYHLEVHMSEPFSCWCGLDIVPDAGGSTVSLSVASSSDRLAPDVLAVRDAWVDGLNRLDWG